MRVFRGNNIASGVVSFCISLLSIYGIYRMQWNLSGFFFSLGLSEEVLYISILAILFIALIIAIIKGWAKYFLMILGALLIILALWTDIFYAYFTAFVIGVVLLAIGFWLTRRAKKKKREKAYLETGQYPPSRRSKKLQTIREKEALRGARKRYWGGVKEDWKGRYDTGKNVYNKGKEGVKKAYEKTAPSEREKKMWHDTGYKAGKYIGKKIRGPEFKYGKGMRRGGKKKERTRFVSKKATQRYAQRFGDRKARKRFGKT